jgi:hypothetical protein
LCGRLRRGRGRRVDARDDGLCGRLDDDVAALLDRRLAEELITEDAASGRKADTGYDSYQHRLAHVGSLRGLVVTVPVRPRGLP